ncbi:hypothetical protein V2J09_008145 [Rumex salicifolius]
MHDVSALREASSRGHHHLPLSPYLRCIYEKLSDEECDTCPVCDINLGGDPVDKLRPDHNLQDIRAKIFPIKRGLLDASEVVPSVSIPAKRKERSLSSLVVSAPRVSVHSGMTRKRTRAVMRKSSVPRGSSSSSEETPRKEDLAEDYTDGTSSPETLNKLAQNKKLAYSSKSSNNQNSKSFNNQVDSWKPLNCLVEAANQTKFLKSNSLGPSQVKADQDPAQVAGIHAAKTNNEENGHRGDAQHANSVPSQTKRKRMRPPNRKTAGPFGDSSNSQLVVHSMRHHQQNMPIWFSLVASENQEGAAPLPQLSSGFLRIKNGDMPVSSIQKYVANKLELPSEDEVQIMCHGQAVNPSLQLRGLLEMWLKNVSASKRVKTKVGSSGKDFVMVLTYSRKVQIEASVQQPPENNNS